MHMLIKELVHHQLQEGFNQIVGLGDSLRSDKSSRKILPRAGCWMTFLSQMASPTASGAAPYLALMSLILST